MLLITCRSLPAGGEGEEGEGEEGGVGGSVRDAEGGGSGSHAHNMRWVVTMEKEGGGGEDEGGEGGEGGESQREDSPTISNLKEVSCLGSSRCRRTSLPARGMVPVGRESCPERERDGNKQQCYYSESWDGNFQNSVVNL